MNRSPAVTAGQRWRAARRKRRVVCGCLLWLAAALPGRADESGFHLHLVKPAYRASLYASQPDQTIEVELRAVADGKSADGKLPATPFSGELLDEQGKVFARATAVNGVLRFDARKAPPGMLRVRAKPTGKNWETSQPVVRKLPPSPGSEVCLDAQRNIVIDGRPSVQLGWYGEVRLDDPRPKVLRLQNIQTASTITYPDKSPVSRLYRDHGIRTMVSLEPARLLYAFELWKQPNHPIPTEHTRLSAPSPECVELLRKMVELLRDEPGLFGWYIADEPEINQFRTDYLEAYYRTLAELDPYHPVVVTNDTLDGIEKIGYRCCDILAPDPYGSKPNYVPDFLAQAQRVMGPGQGLMLTPWQAAHHTHFTRDYGTEPPYAYRVTRGQHLVTLAAGGRGFAGYASDFFLPEPRLRVGLPRIWQEIRWLEPALALPAEKPMLEPATGIWSWLAKNDQHVWLIVMNATAEKRTVKVSHPALTMSKLPVISEGRSVSVKAGSFSDEIAPGEASIYSTDPAGLKLPTVAEVEAEIAAFEQASIKPGNVLHASRGVKARASQGTTPWFAQIYYYAINGIDDDAGWHVTHAELPQWIEFSLPQETSLQRVVLRTPNLRDYDLLFRAEDGSVQRAEVRGNTQEVAEHVLAAPVKTLKLRLVGVALREGAQPPRAMVREIEAYADAGKKSAAPLALTRVEAPAEPTPSTPAVAATPPLWQDDFSRFAHKPRHYEGDEAAWVMNAEEVSARFHADKKRLDCSIIGQSPYSSLGKLVPCAPEHRFLQITVPRIEGEGYAWLSVSFADPSGQHAARSAVHTLKPGRYTVDTQALHPRFREGEQKQALLNISIMRGIQYALADARLAAQPTDGLAITMADGSPLPRVLKMGDEILFRLFLEQPAADAVVEIYRDSWYEPVRLNGEPYVQLLKSGREKDGRYWSAVVKLGPQTDKFKVTGYPVLFRAVIHEGAVRETFSTLTVDVE